MIINCSDQLVEAYSEVLADNGFNILLIGPLSELKKLYNLSDRLKAEFNVQTFIQQFDSTIQMDLTKKEFKEFAKTLSIFEISFVINNQICIPLSENKN